MMNLMNVAASLHSEQQNQILSVSDRQRSRCAALGREQIEGLKVSRRGSKAPVLSESKTHLMAHTGVSEAECCPAP